MRPHSRTRRRRARMRSLAITKMPVSTCVTATVVVFVVCLATSSPGTVFAAGYSPISSLLSPLSSMSSSSTSSSSSSKVSVSLSVPSSAAPGPTAADLARAQARRRLLAWETKGSRRHRNSQGSRPGKMPPTPTSPPLPPRPQVLEQVVQVAKHPTRDVAVHAALSAGSARKNNADSGTQAKPPAPGDVVMVQSLSLHAPSDKKPTPSIHAPEPSASPSSSHHITSTPSLSAFPIPSCSPSNSALPSPSLSSANSISRTLLLLSPSASESVSPSTSAPINSPVPLVLTWQLVSQSLEGAVLPPPAKEELEFPNISLSLLSSSASSSLSSTPPAAYLHVGTVDWGEDTGLRDTSGKLLFQAEWFEPGEVRRVVTWKQTSAPTESEIRGFEPIDLGGSAGDPAGGNICTGFRGVGKSSSPECAIDGNGGDVCWWNCFAPLAHMQGQEEEGAPGGVGGAKEDDYAKRGGGGVVAEAASMGDARAKAPPSTFQGVPGFGGHVAKGVRLFVLRRTQASSTPTLSPLPSLTPSSSPMSSPSPTQSLGVIVSDGEAMSSAVKASNLPSDAMIDDNDDAEQDPTAVAVDGVLGVGSAAPTQQRPASIDSNGIPSTNSGGVITSPVESSWGWGLDSTRGNNKNVPASPFEHSIFGGGALRFGW